jgi:hypothetical protein
LVFDVEKRMLIKAHVAAGGPLGLVLCAAFDAASKQVVIQVDSVRMGSVMARCGIKIGDWLLKCGDVEIDVWRAVDTTGDGVISESQVAVLLKTIREIAPVEKEEEEEEEEEEEVEGRRLQPTALELMAEYDLDGDHQLSPTEMVALVNDELLGAIVRLIVTVERPASFVFTRSKNDGAAPVAEEEEAWSLAGTLLKRSKMGQWQSRHFVARGCSLYYKNDEAATDFLGGVDLSSPAATVSLKKKGTVLRISGTDVDAAKTSKDGRVRTLKLKASPTYGTAAGSGPSLEEWRIALRERMALLRPQD